MTVKIHSASNASPLVNSSSLTYFESIPVSNERAAFLVRQFAANISVAWVVTWRTWASGSSASTNDVEGWCGPFIILIYYYL